jgi:hypothetical protein
LSLLHDNTRIQTGINKSGEPVLSNHLMAWSTHHKARTYTGGVTFWPGRNAPSNYFNTWRGFSVEPKQNDALLNPIHCHIKNVVCAGHIDLYEYLIKWIAYTIQHPDKPAGAAIVLRGEKGSGKGTLGHFLRAIWGNHGLHISNAKHLVGNFNGHLVDTCFLFADEAFYSGDKQHEGVLKALVTEPTIIVERKGIDAIAQPNYLKILMATNSDFAVPASRDERRYCVIDVSSARIGEGDYFNALHIACSSKEVQSAFLYEMLSMDLTGFHTGEIPDSKGLRDQRYHSMDSVQKWLVEALLNRSFNTEGLSNFWKHELSSSDLFTKYVEFCDQSKASEYKRVTQCKMASYLGKIFEKLKRIDSSNIRGFYFGNIENAIKQFEAYEKVNIEELIK